MTTTKIDSASRIFECAFCGTLSPRRRSTYNKYCSNTCQMKNQQRLSFLEVEAGMAKTSNQVKRYLLQKTGNQCSECGVRDSWNGKPLLMELDHINGRHEENTLQNCRLLCPNCHSQTSTFRAKNKGNGRGYRLAKKASP